ncbi:MAG: helix-turn-helix domain-containing protein [Methylobacterium sp.]|nr:helix-turn-helix domain-containing protein [Methylobacterium sp.]
MIDTAPETLRDKLLNTTAAPQETPPPSSEPRGPRELLENEELLTVEETCRVTRLARPTIYRHLAAGTLTALKLGARTFFRAEDVRRFMSGKAWGGRNAA